MFRRVRRELFEDTELDFIVAAASSIGVPMVEMSSGDLRHVFAVSGGQLSLFESKLREYPDIIGQTIVVLDLLEETIRCSHLYIVSTTYEMLLASDRSPKQYREVNEAYVPFMASYDDFRREGVVFHTKLHQIQA